MKSKNKYKDNCIEYKSTDKTRLTITKDFLDKFVSSAKKLGKKPLLIVSIPKNEKEVYNIEGIITVKNK